jgi:hypothetical protein
MTAGYPGDAAAEIRSGRPHAYFDYIERTYGDAFRAGTTDGIETFVLLFQQISSLGNKEATDSFSERFVPMLPRDARRKIINDDLYKAQMHPAIDRDA